LKVLKRSMLNLFRRVKDPKTYYEGTARTEFELPFSSLMFTRRHSKKLGEEIAYHHRYVLVVNFNGDGKALIDNHVLELRRGYALLIFPHQFHHYNVSPPRPVRWLYITFELNHHNNLKALRNLPVRLSVRTLAYLAETIRSFNAIENDESAGLNRYCMWLGLLLNELAFEARTLVRRDARVSDKGHAGQLISQINSFIVENLSGNLHISDIARAVNLSKDHVRSVYKDATGLSIGHYMKRIKIGRAIELLDRSSMTMSEIAYECGFGSLVSFSRCFKNTMGVSPRLHRRTKGAGRSQKGPVTVN
jgi:AraC-like DNA-binding protein